MSYELEREIVYKVLIILVGYNENLENVYYVSCNFHF